MSVNRELNLARLPTDLRVINLQGDEVIYFRANTLVRLKSTIDIDSRELIVPSNSKIKAFAIHPSFGAPGQSIVAVAFDTGLICLYDYDTNVLSSAHSEHRVRGQLNWIGLIMTEQGSVISVVDNTLVHYCPIANKAKSYNDLLPKKFQATEIKATPLDPDLLAIGSFCGLVVVVSLSKMTVKYSFRGHNYEITSIVWMRNSPSNASGGTLADNDDCFDVYNDDHFRDDFGTMKPKSRERDDFLAGVDNVAPPASSNNDFNFVEACQSLKEDLLRKKTEGTPLRRTQPDREECQKVDLDNTDGSLSSGFSNESNASSSIENRFEKIDLDDCEDLSLVTLDQHMNVWVWDVKLSCAKGNFRIKSTAVTRRGVQNNKKASNHSATLFLLSDQRTMVGNTNTAGFFSLQINFDTGANKLDFDYQVTENNSFVLGTTRDQRFLAYYPYRTMRLVEYVNARETRVIQEFSTYNSLGRTIAVSEVNPMRIAVGTHEVCLFDATTVSDNGCNFTTYYKNIKSLIVCLAWHPEEEILAFGTMEGRIGLYDAKNEKVDLLKPFSGHAIYDLCFGRLGDEVQLFARCFSGTCAVYFNKFTEFKYIFQNLKEVSALHVDHHTRKMFIGTNDGNIHYLDLGGEGARLPQESLPIKVSKKSIRMFSVNCDSSLVAVASKATDLNILQMDRFDSSESVIVALKGHTQPIIWVDWSRKNKSIVISTSYDNTIRLWDIASKQQDGPITAKSCYEFKVQLKYAIFSPLNEDCLIVGTQATAFYVFNMTEKNNDFPPKLIHLMRNDSATPTSTVGKSAVPQPKSESKVAEAKKTINNETTIFYLAKRESTKKALECLQSMVKGKTEGDQQIGTLTKKMFSDDLAEIKDFLLDEVKNYKSSDMKSRGTDLIPLMSGNDVKEKIVQHIKDQSLTDEMVAIAPMISHSFWRLCLEAFSVQLIEEGQPLKAVLFLLSIHKVDDSLEILCGKNYFREAWLLAKLRKPVGSPIFKEISSKWIQNLNHCGDYESAAIVATGVGDYVCAANQLLKRHDDQLTEEHHEMIRLLMEKGEEESTK